MLFFRSPLGEDVIVVGYVPPADTVVGLEHLGDADGFGIGIDVGENGVEKNGGGDVRQF